MVGCIEGILVLSLTNYLLGQIYHFASVNYVLDRDLTCSMYPKILKIIYFPGTPAILPRIWPIDFRLWWDSKIHIL